MTMDKKRRVAIGEDRISLLPDSLLCQILSELPTKHVVSTSVLSKRWTSLWLSVPVLDLDVKEFQNKYAFVNFINGVLNFYREESRMLKLRIAFDIYHDDSPPNLPVWIESAVSRKVEHLDLSCRWGYVAMPLSVYTCDTLVSLKLFSLVLPDFEQVALPRLKIMHLEDNVYCDDALLEKLISSCPVLEGLSVVRNAKVAYDIKVLRVRSQSLKSLVISLSGDDEYYSSTNDSKVVIDAPGLNFLTLKDNQSKSFDINHLSSSTEVDIDVSFNVVIPPAGSYFLEKSVVSKFLAALSRVRDMTISGLTLQIICHYWQNERQTHFPYMTRFHANFYNSELEKLPNFLESCPNLKFLILELEQLVNNEEIILSSSVPECLRSTLDYVEMKTPISGAKAEMKLVKYFLENSVVLKKFKLCLSLSYRGTDKESIIFMELLKIRRCSAACEVVVELEEAYPTYLEV